LDEMPEPAGAPAQADQERPSLSISEAARACAVSRRTIRHHRQAGDFPAAFKDRLGVWRIPQADLEAIGLHPSLVHRLDEPPEVLHIERLRTEVAVLRERLRAAELISLERERRIEDLRLILRLLPGPSLPGEGGPGTSAPRLQAGRARLGSGGETPGDGEEPGLPDEAASPPDTAVAPEPVVVLPDTGEAPRRSEETVQIPVASGRESGFIWRPDPGFESRSPGSDPARAAVSEPPWLGPLLPEAAPRRRWLPWRRSKE
jgi:Helix-turn-helix domain